VCVCVCVWFAKSSPLVPFTSAAHEYSSSNNNDNKHDEDNNKDKNYSKMNGLTLNLGSSRSGLKTPNCASGSDCSLQ